MIFLSEDYSLAAAQAHDWDAAAFAPVPIRAPSPVAAETADALDQFVYTWDSLLDTSVFRPFVCSTTAPPPAPAPHPQEHLTDQQLAEVEVVHQSPVVGPQVANAAHLGQFVIGNSAAVAATVATAAAEKAQEDADDSLVDDDDGEGDGDGDEFVADEELEEEMEEDDDEYRPRTAVAVGVSTIADTPRKKQQYGRITTGGHRMLPRPDSSICALMIAKKQRSAAAATNRNISTRLPDPATEILRTWLLDRLDKPYPSKEEKERLAAETGLTVSQVNNWFINARRRVVRPLLSKPPAERRL